MLLYQRCAQLWRRLSRANRRRVVFYPTLVLGVAAVGAFMTWMPGRSFTGALSPLSLEEEHYRADLAAHVTALAETIGERNLGRAGTMEKTASYLRGELTAQGYAVVGDAFTRGGDRSENLSVEVVGRTRSKEIVLVGAHYDSEPGAPGADDNASGVAATLSLAKVFRGKTPDRSVRFVFFANEEAPYFWTDAMGSLRYARESKSRGDNIVAMLSLESIGYYQDGPGTQHYPFLLNTFYGDRGNFISFVGNVSSRGLVRDSIGTFRASTRMPSEGAALPEFVPGVGWSDHWSFWKQGYDAIMVTDTAPFRNPHYHTAGDLPATLDYARMARVVRGLEHVLDALAR